MQNIVEAQATEGDHNPTQHNPPPLNAMSLLRCMNRTTLLASKPTVTITSRQPITRNVLPVRHSHQGYGGVGGHTDPKKSQEEQDKKPKDVSHNETSKHTTSTSDKSSGKKDFNEDKNFSRGKEELQHDRDAAKATKKH
ncbi:hypothetical protein PROFUN_02064 [Planoprotostelium fungivorum]|uniref:Uncharacterized protein n=1 Tax=Planoprotostelium fungivorum TaxID=1890364 RepID=A0A2P6NBA0_9EUKA|nr:hypothetical protein PROFUN_02064 [Planoprotostelium fungivorum]